MVAQNTGSQRDRVPGVDGPVGPDLQRQLVIVGGVTHTGVLHRVVDLAHRRIDGVHRNHPNDRLGRLVLFRGHIAPAVGERQFHRQGGVGAQSGNIQIWVQNLHVSIRLNVPGRYHTGTRRFNMDGLDAFTVQLGDDPLHIQDDLGDILLHAGDSGKLMLDAGDLNGGHRGARQRGQQDAAQRVA